MDLVTIRLRGRPKNRGQDEVRQDGRHTKLPQGPVQHILKCQFIFDFLSPVALKG